MTDRIAIDTNVMLYPLDKVASDKKRKAIAIIAQKPFFSVQSLSEYINVCNKRLKMNKYEVIVLCEYLLENCTMIPIHDSVAREAFRLVDKYNFQIFDSLIIASALEANCEILYSEDMQHELVIENQLKIVNPFV